MPGAISESARPWRDDGVIELPVLLGIDHIDPAGHDRDRAARERPLVRAGIDAAREAGDHHEAGLAQPGGELAGEAPATRGGIAGADDADHAALEEMGVTAERQDRGRVLDGAQGGGVAGLVAAEEPATKGLERRDLTLGRRARGDANRALPSAALGQLGQGGEGCLGGAEAGEELVEGDRPDVLAADEAKPVQPLALCKRPFARHRATMVNGPGFVNLKLRRRRRAYREEPLSRQAGEGRGPSRRDGKGEGMLDAGAVPHPPIAAQWAPPSPASGRGAWRLRRHV